MTKFSPEYLCLADELLSQYALTQDDQLSGILTKENLDHFQSQYTGGRVRDFPPLKTLSLFMHQAASENKSYRNALIASARDQIAMGREPNKPATAATAKPDNVSPKRVS